MIVQQQNFPDGRTMVMVQTSPRRYKVMIQSSPIHKTSDINFVHVLAINSRLSKKEAIATMELWNRTK